MRVWERERGKGLRVAASSLPCRRHHLPLLRLPFLCRRLSRWRCLRRCHRPHPPQSLRLLLFLFLSQGQAPLKPFACDRPAAASWSSCWLWLQLTLPRVQQRRAQRKEPPPAAVARSAVETKASAAPAVVAAAGPPVDAVPPFPRLPPQPQPRRKKKKGEGEGEQGKALLLPLMMTTTTTSMALQGERKAEGQGSWW